MNLPGQSASLSPSGSERFVFLISSSTCWPSTQDQGQPMRLRHHVTGGSAMVSSSLRPGLTRLSRTSVPRVRWRLRNARTAYWQGRIAIPELVLPRTLPLRPLPAYPTSPVRFNRPGRKAQTPIQPLVPRSTAVPLSSARYLISLISEKAFISRSTTIVNRYLLHAI